jgi:hypothetical protein
MSRKNKQLLWVNELAQLMSREPIAADARAYIQSARVVDINGTLSTPPRIIKGGVKLSCVSGFRWTPDGKVVVSIELEDSLAPQSMIISCKFSDDNLLKFEIYEFKIPIDDWVSRRNPDEIYQKFVRRNRIHQFSHIGGSCLCNQPTHAAVSGILQLLLASDVDVVKNKIITALREAIADETTLAYQVWKEYEDIRVEDCHERARNHFCQAIEEATSAGLTPQDMHMMLDEQFCVAIHES